MSGEAVSAADQDSAKDLAGSDAGPMQVLSAALDRLPAAGSIRASAPAILAKLRKTPGLEPRNLNNLISRVRSLLEYLARVAGDRWENVTPRMIHDWCEGDWADPASGRVPSRASGSKKVRRWSARRALAAAVPTGAIAAGSEVAQCLEPQRSAARPGVCDTDPARIAHVIATWKRRDADHETAGPLLAETRDCVTIAAPSNVSTAKTMLLCVYLALEWGSQKFGSIDRRAVLHPINVECLTMDPDRDWSDRWRAQMRSALRYVGRAVCHELWPDQPHPIAAKDAARPYDTVDEYMLREAALMAGREPRCERLALPGLTLGAGLSGAQAYRSGTDDIFTLDGDRLGVRVQRGRTRIVPIREHYTKLVAEACELRPHGTFFSSDQEAAPSNVAARIEVGGQGSLSLHRTRATFVCAHIRAGTPLDVLNEIAGPISGAYLQQMLAYCAGPLDPTEAANRGLLP